MNAVELARMPYREYLQTDHWATMRRLKLEEAGYRCQVCDVEDGLQVHHRTYERRGKERLNDLTVLCGECHRSYHGKGAPGEEMITVDEAIERAAKILAFEKDRWDALAWLRWVPAAADDMAAEDSRG